MNIEVLALDVDGTLTNGDITYDGEGGEYKSFSVKDGLAIVSWIRMGKKAAIVTGRNSKVVERRAKELGISYVYQNCKNKETALKEIAKKEGIKVKQIAAIGDDLNDYRMLKTCGLSFAPADASEEILSLVQHKLQKNGGEGAIREMVEIILKKDGLYEKFLKLWTED